MADPRWTGIIDVIVSGMGGAVRWEPDSVVLRLPDSTNPGQSGDLDVLSVCLGRVGVPVRLDASCALRRKGFLVAFLRNLVESGLMVDPGRSAA